MAPRLPLALSLASSLALSLTGCVSPAQLAARPGAVVLTPDRDPDPRVVRFDVPTAMLVDIPGGPVPLTLEARRSTHDLAAAELAQRGWCPNGFTGPAGIAFPGGDRGRSVFEVACVVR